MALSIEKKLVSTGFAAKIVSATKTINISLPLEIKVSAKKKFILNMNNMRVAHYRTLTAAKKGYAKLVYQIAPKLDYIISKCEIEITYFSKTNRRVDLSNTCSVCDKFATDAFTDLLYWRDDNVTNIGKVCYIFGGLDRENPRFEYKIKVLKFKQK